MAIAHAQGGCRYQPVHRSHTQTGKERRPQRPSWLTDRQPRNLPSHVRVTLVISQRLSVVSWVCLLAGTSLTTMAWRGALVAGCCMRACACSVRCANLVPNELPGCQSGGGLRVPARRSDDTRQKRSGLATRPRSLARRPRSNRARQSRPSCRSVCTGSHAPA